MARKLSKKQRDFIEEYAQNGENGTQAALAVYDTEDNNTAAAIASENLTKPNVIAAIHERLPDDLLLQKHLEGLDATKLSGTGGMRLSVKADGDVEQFGHSDLEVPDYGVRFKYLDAAYRLRGDYAPEKHLTFDIKIKSPETAAKALQFDEWYKQQGHAR